MSVPEGLEALTVTARDRILNIEGLPVWILSSILTAASLYHYESLKSNEIERHYDKSGDGFDERREYAEEQLARIKVIEEAYKAALDGRAPERTFLSNLLTNETYRAAVRAEETRAEALAAKQDTPLPDFPRVRCLGDARALIRRAVEYAGYASGTVKRMILGIRYEGSDKAAEYLRHAAELFNAAATELDRYSSLPEDSPDYEIKIKDCHPTPWESRQ